MDCSSSRHPEYRYKTEFQSHEPEFDYLKSLEMKRKSTKSNGFWKVQEKKIKKICNFNLDPSKQLRNGFICSSNAPTSLRLPMVTSHDTSLLARCRRTFAHAHDYHINSISNNSDGETFISADGLRINLWNLEINSQSFNIVHMKPANMEDLTEAGMAEADSVVDESSVVTVSVVAALTKDLLTKLFYHNHVDFESRCIANFAEVSALVDVYEGEAVTKLINEKIPYFNASIYLQNKTQIGKVDEIFGLKGSQSDGRIFGHLPDIYARAPVLPMAITQDTIVAIRKRDAWESEKLLRLANVNDKYTMCTYPVHPDKDSVSRPFKLPLRYSSLIKTCYVPQIHALQGTFHQLELTPVANGSQNRLTKEVISKCESIEWQIHALQGTFHQLEHTPVANGAQNRLIKEVISKCESIEWQFFLTMLITGFKVARTANELNKWQDFMTKSTLGQQQMRFMVPVWSGVVRLRDCAAVLGVFAKAVSGCAAVHSKMFIR
ncbi:hypothetical protein LXL04_034089 [Taraxacum kok-saghyz]